MKHRLVNSAISLALLISASSAMAATEYGPNDVVDNSKMVGQVSAQIVDGTMADATAQLAHKCDKLGAAHFKVIDMDRPGDGGAIYAHAAVYK